MTPIRRGEGRSAVAAAAYRSGWKLRDERTGKTHDYSRRRGVAEVGVVGWSVDRSELWNVAERSERHPRAVVAREITVALPYELPPAARRKLVTDFSEFLHQRHGLAIDWALHEPPPRSPLNFHAHLLLTTRRVGADGRSLGAKTRELDVQDTGGEHIQEWRRTWATFVNTELWLAGVQKAVDHRSHREAGRAREPQEHLGPAATALEDQGVGTAAGRRNRRRRERDRRRAGIAQDLKAVRREVAYQLASAAKQIGRELIDFVTEPPQRQR